MRSLCPASLAFNKRVLVIVSTSSRDASKLSKRTPQLVCFLGSPWFHAYPGCLAQWNSLSFYSSPTTVIFLSNGLFPAPQYTPLPYTLVYLCGTTYPFAHTYTFCQYSTLEWAAVHDQGPVEVQIWDFVFLVGRPRLQATPPRSRLLFVALSESASVSFTYPISLDLSKCY